MTVVMNESELPAAASIVSKAVFKARALEILRRVEATGEPVIITDRGRPVLRLAPYFGDDDAVLASLRGTVVAYHDPTEPVEETSWEALA
jgi:prevent-host-death family protein